MERAVLIYVCERLSQVGGRGLGWAAGSELVHRPIDVLVKDWENFRQVAMQPEDSPYHTAGQLDEAQYGIAVLGRRRRGLRLDVVPANGHALVLSDGTTILPLKERHQSLRRERFTDVCHVQALVLPRVPA